MSLAGAFLCTQSAWLVGEGLPFSPDAGKRKERALASAAQCQEREKTLRFKIKKIWKQTIDFSTRKVLNSIRFDYAPCYMQH
ncbi:hypothetical protein [Aeromonas enteropelogenes]|uniref:hypothetical protein n=1 Tax=Aeromonas enteropelogenes TaxID=29489 RepID=UPI00398589ED